MSSADESFKSYVNFHLSVHEKDKPEYSASYELPEFLDGEVVASQCDKVILYSDENRGLLGKLYCTNFRIIFLPLSQNKTALNFGLSEILIDKYHTALSCVEEIFYSTATESKKLRLLSSPLSGLEQVSKVKIYCKDFRVLTLDFQHSQFAVQLTNTIFHFAFPSKLENLFTCGVGSAEGHLRFQKHFPTFNRREDWHRELQRTGAGAHGWRITQFNSNFRHIDRFENCIAKCHPKNCLPRVVDVSCVTRQKLHSSYCSLRRVCTTESSRQFWIETDGQWLSQLDSCQWLNLLSKCLELSLEVISASYTDQLSVIIKESEGCDISCVVSSISQICLDPFYRTFDGFSMLIQKEWVALGHPFGLRIHGLNQVGRQNDQMSPVFLLFLDCVHQIIERYPGEFQFSQFYLLALWDLVLTGLTGTFTWNGLKEAASLGSYSSAWPLIIYEWPPQEHRRLDELASQISNLIIDRKKLENPNYEAANDRKEESENEKVRLRNKDTDTVTSAFPYSVEAVPVPSEYYGLPKGAAIRLRDTSEEESASRLRASYQIATSADPVLSVHGFRNSEPAITDIVRLNPTSPPRQPVRSAPPPPVAKQKLKQAETTVGTVV